MRQAIIRYVLVLLLAVTMGSFPRQPQDVHAPNPSGHYERVSGMHLLCLQGSPYEMGLQQGTLLREQVRELVKLYLYEHALLEYGPLHPWLLAHARPLDRTLPTALRSEMRGIADGAGLSYQDVLLLNILPDLLALSCASPSVESSGSPFPIDAVVRPAIRCPQNGRAASSSNFAVWDSATVDGGLLVGHSQDSAEADLLGRYWMVVARRPAQGNAFVSAGPMGMVGVWTGMNEEQVVAVLSSSPSVDLASSGQPPQFLLRQVLERAGDLTQAKRVLLSADRLYGGNVLLGDSKAPGAVAIEMSAHRHAVFETDVGSEPLVRTNHFLDPALAMAQRNALSGPARSASLARLGALQSLLELNEGWIGADKALALLMDDVDGRFSGGFGTQSWVNEPDTSQSVLFDPARLALWVTRRDVEPPSAPGSTRAADRSYLQLTLKSLLSRCLVGG